MYDLGFTLRLYVRFLCWVRFDFFQKFYGGLFFTSAWLVLLKLKILSAGKWYKYMSYSSYTYYCTTLVRLLFFVVKYMYILNIIVKIIKNSFWKIKSTYVRLESVWKIIIYAPSGSITLIILYYGFKRSRFFPVLPGIILWNPCFKLKKIFY